MEHLKTLFHFFFAIHFHPEPSASKHTYLQFQKYGGVILNITEQLFLRFLRLQYVL